MCLSPTSLSGPSRFPLSFLPYQGGPSHCSPHCPLVISPLGLPIGTPCLDLRVGAVPRAQLASWDVAGGCTGCSCHLDIQSEFWTRSSHFHFGVGPTSFVASPASEPRNPLWGLEEQRDTQNSEVKRKGGPDIPGQVRRKQPGSSWEAGGGFLPPSPKPGNPVRQERLARGTRSQSPQGLSP